MIVAFTYHYFPSVFDAESRLAAALGERLAAEGFAPIDVRPAGASPIPDWTAPDLLFSQTCGLPFVSGLDKHVQLIATPHYVGDGCDGPNYCSMIIVRADDPAEDVQALQGRRAAINGFKSQSGCNALFAVLPEESAAAPFFSDLHVSGGHARSIAAVAAGRADCAAIDSVCWDFAKREAPQEVAALRVLTTSPPTPGLPFITSGARPTAEVSRIRHALAAFFDDPGTADDRAACGLTGFSVLGPDAYAPVAAMAARVAPRVAHFARVGAR